MGWWECEGEEVPRRKKIGEFGMSFLAPGGAGLRWLPFPPTGLSSLVLYSATVTK